ncbi:hypothetical protein [Dyadobacter sp. 676]|uniref:BBC1/AIM3 cysteine proteinase-fold domain-containing protein n=1 Tax=Dyadobacter sp. 676 TaxID=3088362 RepID=A0AAU8FSQ1_9BACT
MSVLGNAVAQFAQTNLGNQVGNGECWTLAERALQSAGARTSTEIMGRIGPDDNYVWGDAVTAASLEVGDIIQFRNYSFRFEGSDGSWSEESRPHHTAIVASIDTSGAVEVFECNVNGSKKVQRNRLYLRTGALSGGSVTVSGQMWFYRPQPRQTT